MNKKFVKPLLIFGGGLLLFMLLKPKNIGQKLPKETKSFDDLDTNIDVVDKSKNAQIVAKAYTSAVENGESQQRLDELNKELMKEFGMECRLSSSGKPVVFDKNGKKIASAE